MTSTSQTPRLLRLTIKLYKSQGRQGGEGHDFAREYVVKAAKLHAKHGIYMYQQVDTILLYPSNLSIKLVTLIPAVLFPTSLSLLRGRHEPPQQPRLGNRCAPSRFPVFKRI
jgi:hypothetical protein